MTRRTGFYACDDVRDTEGDIRRLLETLGEALALADLVDVDLVAIHIANAIHAAERHAFTKALQRLESDIVGAVTALAAKQIH